MGRKRDLSQLPEIGDGLTIADLAKGLTEFFQSPVTSQQVHYLLERCDLPLGRRSVRRLVVREDEVMAVSPDSLQELVSAYREVYLRPALDEGLPTR